ncbi:MAG: hypothetical protein JHC84_16985 [Solirubrobacteraceae bacterium]|nr:hypothetical protein [Solirubrobacteraceae bacterium]
MTVFLALPAATAGAASVAYIDGGEVWQSTLDGSRKVQLSAGEGKYTELAAADGGRVLGAQRNGALTSSLTFTTIWNPDGTVFHKGALVYEPGWSTYTYPVGLDLTASGGVVVYGFSNSRPSGLPFPNPFTTFSFGHTIMPATNSVAGSALPIYKRAPEWPSVVNDRVVGVSGSSIVLQDDVPSKPGSEESDFKPWFTLPIPANDLNGADVAANGRAIAWRYDVAVGGGTQSRIDLAPIASANVASTPDFAAGCTLPAQGSVFDISISQDATRIAWKDDGGVKVAGIPNFNGANDCVFTSPPVVISATGKSPSISGADVVAAPVGGGSAAGAPPLPPTTSSGVTPTAPSTGPAAAAPRVTAPGKLKTSLLRTTGAPISVTVSRPGKVVATLASGRVVIARGTATARKAGKLTVKLKATKAGKSRLRRLKGKKATLKVTAGGRTATSKVTLR